jgi:hypothetical protein
MQKNEKFPTAFEVRNDLLTQGYGVDRAKSSTRPHRYAKHCGQESTRAESSARALPTNKLTSVHSRNSAPGE